MVAGLLMTACSSSDNQVAPVSFDTIVTTPTTVAATTVPATTAMPTTVVTTVPATTSAPETTIPGLSGPVFSDALGVKVATAPGVNTPGDTRQLLPEGLYVHIAWQPDPNDPSVFTVQPGDEEILEAYANAVATYYRAASTDVTTDDPDFATYYADSGALFDTSFAQARDGGYVLALGNGVVLRPYVLGDQRTDSTAIVFDCYLENQEYVLRAGGSPMLGPLETSGQIVTMKIVDGAWKVDQAGAETQACL